MADMAVGLGKEIRFFLHINYNKYIITENKCNNSNKYMLKPLIFINDLLNVC